MSTPGHTRREFLQGEGAVAGLRKMAAGNAEACDHDATGSIIPGNAASGDASPAGPFLAHLGRRAMACDFELYFNGRQYAHDTEAGLAALDRIDELEDQLSIYREQSELSRINRTAAGGPVEVEAGLFRLLQQTLELYASTGGAYDMTASPLSRAWGFFQRAGQKPSEAELAEARQRVGSQFVRLDESRQSIEFLRPGIELSLNSIGKGYALDRVRDVLAEHGIDDFLFHGGNSSVLAVGSQTGAKCEGWTVGLRHPLRPELRLAEFHLRNEALGTSGVAAQHFHYQGKRYGHLLDPRTGWPADGVYSATVIAPTAAEADALSTAFYVLGPEGALDYCGRRPEVAMALVVPGAKGGSIEIVSAGLDAARWTRHEDFEGNSAGRERDEFA